MVIYDDFDDESLVDEVDEDLLRDEYEFYDEWLERDPELYHIGLEEFNEMRCIESYGDDTYDIDNDDDSYDPY